LQSWKASETIRWGGKMTHDSNVVAKQVSILLCGGPRAVARCSKTTQPRTFPTNGGEIGKTFRSHCIVALRVKHGRVRNPTWNWGTYSSFKRGNWLYLILLSLKFQDRELRSTFLIPQTLPGLHTLPINLVIAYFRAGLVCTAFKALLHIIYHSHCRWQLYLMIMSFWKKNSHPSASSPHAA